MNRTKVLIATVFAVTANTVAMAAPLPKTVLLQSDLVMAIDTYLEAHPYGEVVRLVDTMKACIAEQVPNAQGVTVSNSLCPEVLAKLQADQAELQAAKAAAAPKP